MSNDTNSDLPKPSAVRPRGATRTFAPSIPQRRVAQGESLLVSAVRNAKDEPSRGSRGGSRGRPRGGNPPKSSFNEPVSKVASGPFSMGPSLRNSQAGFISSGDSREYVKEEYDAVTTEFKEENSDVQYALGNTDDMVPFVLPKHKNENNLEFVGSSKRLIDGSTHLLQLPPLLLPFDAVNVDGPVGRLVVRQSGKTEMWVGAMHFDVTQAPPFSFLQIIAAVDSDARQCFALSDVGSMFVCSPNLDTLLLEREAEIRRMAL